MAGGSASKNKGSGFERDLCKLVGEVLGGSFVRSNNSGAYVGGKNRVRKEFLSDGQTRAAKGDIVPPDHLPRFVVEAKFYAEFRFHQLLTNAACPQLDEWIDQAMDCIDAGDFWMVAFKINLRGSYAVIPEAEWPLFEIGNHAVYRGRAGSFRVTDLASFVRQNSAAIIERCR